MLPRFQHILVPLDFTEKNQQALDIAFEMALAGPAHVTLMHVIERIDLPGDDDVESFNERLQERAEGEMKSRARRFTDAKIAIDWEIRIGSRAPEIVAYETERAVDLIVMSSHGIDPEHPARSLATLSYQVAVMAKCPVLLVK